MSYEAELMCWLCYKVTLRSWDNTKKWTYENVKGINFWTCPDCQEEDDEDE